MAKPKNIGDEIHRLRNLGYSYTKIMNELKCSKSNISYHLGIGQKYKSFTRQNKRRKALYKIDPLLRKIEDFKYRCNKSKQSRILRKNNNINRKIQSFFKTNRNYKMSKVNITKEQVIEKFGKQPKCYLTGKQLDWYDSSTYSFDHVIPISKGGESSIENMQVCDPQVNICKSSLTSEQFIELCKQVLTNNGYELKKLQELALPQHPSI